MINKVDAKVNDLIGWTKVRHEVEVLSNGKISIALLDIVDDWGEHICDATVAEQILIRELDCKWVNCKDTNDILDEMGLKDDSADGWDQTWSVVLL